MKLSEQQNHRTTRSMNNATVCFEKNKLNFTETATNNFINLAKIFKQIHTRLAIEGKLPDNVNKKPIKL